MGYLIRGILASRSCGAIAQGARDMEEARLKARHMLLAGMENVTIDDGNGTTISGEELVAICLGGTSAARNTLGLPVSSASAERDGGMERDAPIQSLSR
jgi:hypothetical protein